MDFIQVQQNFIVKLKIFAFLDSGSLSKIYNNKNKLIKKYIKGTKSLFLKAMNLDEHPQYLFVKNNTLKHEVYTQGTAMSICSFDSFPSPHLVILGTGI